MVNVSIKDTNGRTLYISYLVTSPESAFHPDEPSIQVQLTPVIMSERDADFLVREWSKFGGSTPTINPSV